MLFTSWKFFIAGVEMPVGPAGVNVTGPSLNTSLHFRIPSGDPVAEQASLLKRSSYEGIPVRVDVSLPEKTLPNYPTDYITIFEGVASCSVMFDPNMELLVVNISARNNSIHVLSSIRYSELNVGALGSSVRGAQEQVELRHIAEESGTQTVAAGSPVTTINNNLFLQKLITGLNGEQKAERLKCPADMYELMLANLLAPVDKEHYFSISNYNIFYSSDRKNYSGRILTYDSYKNALERQKEQHDIIIESDFKNIELINSSFYGTWWVYEEVFLPYITNFIQHYKENQNYDDTLLDCLKREGNWSLLTFNFSTTFSEDPFKELYPDIRFLKLVYLLLDLKSIPNGLVAPLDIYLIAVMNAACKSYFNILSCFSYDKGSYETSINILDIIGGNLLDNPLVHGLDYDAAVELTNRLTELFRAYVMQLHLDLWGYMYDISSAARTGLGHTMFNPNNKTTLDFNDVDSLRRHELSPAINEVFIGSINLVSSNAMRFIEELKNIAKENFFFIATPLSSLFKGFSEEPSLKKGESLVTYLRKTEEEHNITRMFLPEDKIRNLDTNFSVFDFISAKKIVDYSLANRFVSFNTFRNKNADIPFPTLRLQDFSNYRQLVGGAGQTLPPTVDLLTAISTLYNPLLFSLTFPLNKAYAPQNYKINNFREFEGDEALVDPEKSISEVFLHLNMNGWACPMCNVFVQDRYLRYQENLSEDRNFHQIRVIYEPEFIASGNVADKNSIPTLNYIYDCLYPQQGVKAFSEYRDSERKVRFKRDDGNDVYTYRNSQIYGLHRTRTITMDSELNNMYRLLRTPDPEDSADIVASYNSQEIDINELYAAFDGTFKSTMMNLYVVSQITFKKRTSLGWNVVKEDFSTAVYYPADESNRLGQRSYLDSEEEASRKITEYINIYWRTLLNHCLNIMYGTKIPNPTPAPIRESAKELEYDEKAFSFFDRAGVLHRAFREDILRKFIASWNEQRNIKQDPVVLTESRFTRFMPGGGSSTRVMEGYLSPGSLKEKIMEEVSGDLQKLVMDSNENRSLFRIELLNNTDNSVVDAGITKEFLELLDNNLFPRDDITNDYVRYAMHIKEVRAEETLVFPSTFTPINNLLSYDLEESSDLFKTSMEKHYRKTIGINVEDPYTINVENLKTLYLNTIAKSLYQGAYITLKDFFEVYLKDKPLKHQAYRTVAGSPELLSSMVYLSANLEDNTLRINTGVMSPSREVADRYPEAMDILQDIFENSEDAIYNMTYVDLIPSLSFIHNKNGLVSPIVTVLYKSLEEKKELPEAVVELLIREKFLDKEDPTPSTAGTIGSPLDARPVTTFRDNPKASALGESERARYSRTNMLPWIYLFMKGILLSDEHLPVSNFMPKHSYEDYIKRVWDKTPSEGIIPYYAGMRTITGGNITFPALLTDAHTSRNTRLIVGGRAGASSKGIRHLAVIDKGSILEENPRDVLSRILQATLWPCIVYVRVSEEIKETKRYLCYLKLTEPDKAISITETLFPDSPVYITSNFEGEDDSALIEEYFEDFCKIILRDPISIMPSSNYEDDKISALAVPIPFEHLKKGNKLIFEEVFGRKLDSRITSHNSGPLKDTGDLRQIIGRSIGFYLAKKLNELPPEGDSYSFVGPARRPEGRGELGHEYRQQIQKHAEVVKYIKKISEMEGVDPLLMIALAYRESRFDQNRGSEQGAKGIMQLTNITIKEITRLKLVEDIPNFDYIGNWQHNVIGGIRYFRELKYRRVTQWNLPQGVSERDAALAAYNAGPTIVGRVLSDHGRLPKIEETENYVKGINEVIQEKGASLREAISEITGITWRESEEETEIRDISSVQDSDPFLLTSIIDAYSPNDYVKTGDYGDARPRGDSPRRLHNGIDYAHREGYKASPKIKAPFRGQVTYYLNSTSGSRPLPGYGLYLVIRPYIPNVDQLSTGICFLMGHLEIKGTFRAIKGLNNRYSTTVSSFLDSADFAQDFEYTGWDTIKGRAVTEIPEGKTPLSEIRGILPLHVKVEAGDLIGVIGHTGDCRTSASDSRGDHLHIQAHRIRLTPFVKERWNHGSLPLVNTDYGFTTSSPAIEDRDKRAAQRTLAERTADPRTILAEWYSSDGTPLRNVILTSDYDDEGIITREIRNIEAIAAGVERRASHKKKETLATGPGWIRDMVENRIFMEMRNSMATMQVDSITLPYHDPYCIDGNFPAAVIYKDDILLTNLISQNTALDNTGTRSTLSFSPGVSVKKITTLFLRALQNTETRDEFYRRGPSTTNTLTFPYPIISFFRNTIWNKDHMNRIYQDMFGRPNFVFDWRDYVIIKPENRESISLTSLMSFEAAYEGFILGRAFKVEVNVSAFLNDRATGQDTLLLDKRKWGSENLYTATKAAEYSKIKPFNSAAVSFDPTYRRDYESEALKAFNIAISGSARESARTFYDWHNMFKYLRSLIKGV